MSKTRTRKTPATVVNPDPLLTVQQAAKYAGFSTRFIERRIQTGAIVSVSFGYARRIRLSALEAWMNAGEAGDSQ